MVRTHNITAPINNLPPQLIILQNKMYHHHRHHSINEHGNPSSEKWYFLAGKTLLAETKQSIICCINSRTLQFLSPYKRNEEVLGIEQLHKQHHKSVLSDKILSLLKPTLQMNYDLGWEKKKSLGSPRN